MQGEAAGADLVGRQVKQAAQLLLAQLHARHPGTRRGLLLVDALGSRVLTVRRRGLRHACAKGVGAVLKGESLKHDGRCPRNPLSTGSCLSLCATG